MISILFGIIAAVLGGYGIFFWADDFFSFLKGVLPFTLFCGGIVAILAGIFSFRK